MNLGENIKRLRKDKGLTQKELAKLSGVSVPTLQRYENENKGLNFEKIKKIADALEVTTSQLLGTDYASQSDAVDKFISDIDATINPNTDIIAGQTNRNRKQKIIAYNTQYLTDSSLDKVAIYTQDLLKVQAYDNEHSDDESPEMPPTNATSKPAGRKSDTAEKR